MNKEAYERLICILLAQIDALQQDNETRAMIHRNESALIEVLKEELEQLKRERRKENTRKVGRPKGSKNRPKEVDPLFDMIIKLMEGKTLWRGTASELIEQLAPFNTMTPLSPYPELFHNKLPLRLEKIRSRLAKAGIEFASRREGNIRHRMLTLMRTEN